MSAKIVGATLAKSYLSETLRERKFDTVILDEASMASIPALWCASYLAESSIVIVGDFLQLPPIVMADTPMPNSGCPSRAIAYWSRRSLMIASVTGAIEKAIFTRFSCMPTAKRKLLSWTVISAASLPKNPSPKTASSLSSTSMSIATWPELRSNIV